MRKKTALISLTTLLFFVITGQCLADVVAQFEQAQTYEEQRQYEQAEQIYWQIATDHQGTDDALKAQKNLVCLYIADDNQPWAQAALGQLLADFAGHKRLPHTIHKIAEQCHESGIAGRAKELFQNTLPEQANSPQVIWLHMGLAISDILLGNDNAAWTSIETLLSDFTADERCVEAVGQVAFCYRKLEEYENARMLYQHVVDNWPNKPRAIFSQRGIVLVSIALGDSSEAEAATEKLLSQFSQDEHLPKVVSTIAETYRGLEEYEQARELHQYVLDNHPDFEDAIFSQRGVIISSIELGDDSRAEAGIDELLSQFSSNEHIAKVVYQVARKLNKKDDIKAQELYQYVLDNWPDSEWAIFSQGGLVKSNIELGDEAAGQAALDKLIADFADHPDLPLVLWQAAEGYYNQAFWYEKEGLDVKAGEYFTKVIALGERIREQSPASPATIEAHLITGECYRRLGEHEKAVEYFQQVVDDWPDYQYACNAQCIIGECYEKLRDSGALPESEANPLIEQAYQAVIEKYPDCSLAGHAHLKLSQLSSEMGQLVDAAEYYELFLENYPQDTRYSQILYHLAQTYEKMGELDRAVVEIYRIFLEIAEPGDWRIKAVQTRLARLQAAQNDN